MNQNQHYPGQKNRDFSHQPASYPAQQNIPINTTPRSENCMEEDPPSLSQNLHYSQVGYLGGPVNGEENVDSQEQQELDCQAQFIQEYIPPPPQHQKQQLKNRSRYVFSKRAIHIQPDMKNKFNAQEREDSHPYQSTLMESEHAQTDFNDQEVICQEQNPFQVDNYDDGSIAPNTQVQRGFTIKLNCMEISPDAPPLGIQDYTDNYNEGGVLVQEQQHRNPQYPRSQSRLRKNKSRQGILDECNSQSVQVYNGGDYHECNIFEEDHRNAEPQYSITGEEVTISAQEETFFNNRQNALRQSQNLKRHGQNSRIHEHHLEQVSQLIETDQPADTRVSKTHLRGSLSATKLKGRLQANGCEFVEHISPPQFIEGDGNNQFIQQTNWFNVDDEIQQQQIQTEPNYQVGRNQPATLQEQYPPQYREFNNRSSMMQNRPSSATNRNKSAQGSQPPPPIYGRSGVGVIQQQSIALPPPQQVQNQGVQMRPSLMGSPVQQNGKRQGPIKAIQQMAILNPQQSEQTSPFISDFQQEVINDNLYTSNQAPIQQVSQFTVDQGATFFKQRLDRTCQANPTVTSHVFQTPVIINSHLDQSFIQQRPPSQALSRERVQPTNIPQLNAPQQWNSPDMVQNKALKIEERYLTHSSSKLGQLQDLPQQTVNPGGDPRKSITPFIENSGDFRMPVANLNQAQQRFMQNQETIKPAKPPTPKAQQPRKLATTICTPQKAFSNANIQSEDFQSPPPPQSNLFNSPMTQPSPSNTIVKTSDFMIRRSRVGALAQHNSSAKKFDSPDPHQALPQVSIHDQQYSYMAPLNQVSEPSPLGYKQATMALDGSVKRGAPEGVTAQQNISRSLQRKRLLMNQQSTALLNPHQEDIQHFEHLPQFGNQQQQPPHIQIIDNDNDEESPKIQSLHSRKQNQLANIENESPSHMLPSVEATIKGGKAKVAKIKKDAIVFNRINAVAPLAEQPIQQQVNVQRVVVVRKNLGGVENSQQENSQLVQQF